MSRYRIVSNVLALFCIAFSGHANAAEICAFSVAEMEKNPAGTRIAKVACEEHALWHKPFINAQGRIVRLGPMEAERDALADKTTPAWKRVLWYWRESGLLDRNADWERTRIADKGDTGRNGASDCADDTQDWGQRAACRAFLIDVPWSAVFVSYTMKRAAIADFTLSSSHFYYIRDAARNPETSPYRLADPAKETPEVGDLICYAREKGRVFGYAQFAEYVRGAGDKLDSHCDIVVASNLDRDSKLYAIGGNVMQGVTMRKLTLNARGRLSLPMKRDGDADRAFDPRNESTENMNRQDWVGLLKLNRERVR
ncbi:MAG: DUF2272 domain-containing protein [Xanthomonadaceae bacterium]|nr:DUF2272 domain-containing protein [Xanthomonadaceae bacterium]